MPPRMTTQSVSRSTAAPRGGRTGEQTGRGGGRTREPTSIGGGRTGEQDGQGGDRGNEANRGVDEVHDFSTGIVHTRGREAAVGMTWEDFKALMIEEFSPNNEMQKLETEF
ncbi:hypothetical protein Tco_0217355 [Tanacetum coccineum]